MDVEVYYGGQRSGTISYTVLPAFRLFCKQNGFQIKWDAKNKRIDLDSGLKGKVCVLSPGGMTGEAYYEREILGKVYRFLTDFGMEVVIAEKKTDLPKERDVAIRFIVKAVRTAVKPRLELFQTEDEKRKGLLGTLQAELKHTGIACVLKAHKEMRPNPAFLTVQLLLPIDADLSSRKAAGEKIAFYLASAILRYFQSAQQISPISYLPPHIVKDFFSGDWREREEAVQPVHEAEAEANQEPVQDRGLEPEQEQEQKPEPEQKPEQERVEQPVEQPDGEPHTLEPDPQPVSKEPTEPAEASALREAERHTAAEKRLEAEVYFDYTLFHSDLESRPFLLIGNLYVKNTGTEELINPIVCLRVSPVDSIKLGGQILPPNLVETMGVQSSSGVKGWRYLEEDWFSQAQERGEYWIAPIQPVLILPKATEPFQNFQISIKKPETGSHVTVEAVVLFNEQSIHFPANNRIAISF